ncbi:MULTISPECIES: DUF1499 domain-containing protein [Cohaesibacter]|uniref:DUF1499 domain-containing protein n=1 Tax=Cohaesibacter TaxID=655352 RepID=UPI000DEB2389|nr:MULTISPECIES: DUF1499 domain-containing protein [Cohaesibacter]
MNGIVGGVVLAIASFIIIAFYLNITPPTDLGVREGRLPALSARPNGVSSQAADEEKRVPSLAFKADITQTVDAVKQAFEALGTVAIIKEKPTYIHAIAVSPIFRFRDDVEVYFDVAARKVHYRSQSRVGFADMGENRQRFEAFKLLYEAEE